MARQTWMADVVADAFRSVKGYKVETYSGWSSRGSTSFAPVGVMNHHTGPGGYDNLLNYMLRGSSISPLCNIATSRPYNGIVRITICTAGRANHAGRGNYSWIEQNNGNYRTIGIENQNSGNQAWPQQQVEGIRILTASLLDHMGRPASRAIDHKTYAPTRKVDRYATSVSSEQKIIGKVMEQGIALDPWEEYYMSLSKSDKEKMDKLLGLSDSQLGNLISYANTIGSSKLSVLDELVTEIKNRGGSNPGSSFANQFYIFHDNERPELQRFLQGLSEMNSSGLGSGRAFAAMWREAGARGWLRDLDRFRENKVYTEEDLK